MIGVDIPTQDEMAEIEDSSRLYFEQRRRLHDRDPAFARPTPAIRCWSPVTFILTGGRLVTVRYDTPRAFQTFPDRAERLDLGCIDGKSVLMALLDAIVERLADILETVGARVEALSREVFRRGAEASGRRRTTAACCRASGSRATSSRTCCRAW